MSSLSEEGKSRLHDQLIKLGDMMGDGLHHEPDGKWISTEYRRVCRALGIGPPRKNNGEAINKAMGEFLAKNPCGKCGGTIKQTRSGSMRSECTSCGAKYQAKRSKKVK